MNKKKRILHLCMQYGSQSLKLYMCQWLRNCYQPFFFLMVKKLLAAFFFAKRIDRSFLGSFAIWTRLVFTICSRRSIFKSYFFASCWPYLSNHTKALINLTHILSPPFNLIKTEQLPTLDSSRNNWTGKYIPSYVFL